MIPSLPRFASRLSCALLPVCALLPALDPPCAFAQDPAAYYVDISPCMEQSEAARRAACYAELESLVRDLREHEAATPPTPPSPSSPPSPAAPPRPGQSPGVVRLGGGRAGTWETPSDIGVWVRAPGGQRVFVVLQPGE